jgi:hypothetical protein
LALAVTGDRDRSSQEEVGYLQRKIINRGGVYAEALAKLDGQKAKRKSSDDKAKLLKASRKRLKSRKTAKKS